MSAVSGGVRAPGTRPRCAAALAELAPDLGSPARSPSRAGHALRDRAQPAERTGCRARRGQASRQVRPRDLLRLPALWREGGAGTPRAAPDLPRGGERHHGRRARAALTFRFDPPEYLVLRIMPRS